MIKFNAFIKKPEFDKHKYKKIYHNGSLYLDHRI